MSMARLNTKLDKIQQPVLDESKIKVNQEVQDSINIRNLYADRIYHICAVWY